MTKPFMSSCFGTWGPSLPKCFGVFSSCAISAPMISPVAAAPAAIAGPSLEPCGEWPESRLDSVSFTPDGRRRVAGTVVESELLEVGGVVCDVSYRPCPDAVRHNAARAAGTRRLGASRF